MQRLCGKEIGPPPCASISRRPDKPARREAPRSATSSAETIEKEVETLRETLLRAMPRRRRTTDDTPPAAPRGYLRRSVPARSRCPPPHAAKPRRMRPQTPAFAAPEGPPPCRLGHRQTLRSRATAAHFRRSRRAHPAPPPRCPRP